MTVAVRSYYLSLLAEAYGHVGQTAEEPEGNSRGASSGAHYWSNYARRRPTTHRHGHLP